MFVGAVVLFVTYSALPVAVHARVAGDTTVPVLAGRQAGVGSTQGGSAPASGRVLLRSDRFTPVVVAGLGAGALDVPVDTPVVADTPVARPRPRAIEYSDAYNTRLTIHRIGSYTMLPLFAQPSLGDIDQDGTPDVIASGGSELVNEMITISRKLVPHRGCSREYSAARAGTSSSPASKQEIVLCSAPWYWKTRRRSCRRLIAAR